MPEYSIDEREATAHYCVVLAERKYDEAKGSFVAYLHRTLVNEMKLEAWKKMSVLKIVRKDFMRTELPRQESGCISEMDVVGGILSVDDRIDLESMLSTLKDDDRHVVGRVLAGLSYADIARERGCTRANVSLRMKKIVASLQEMVA